MTDWEERYRTDDMPWEKGRAAPPLQELLEDGDIGRWGKGPVLVPGCGFGHDVRLLVEKLSLPVTGLDLAPTAVRQARRFPKAGREVYETGDFFDPAWRRGRTFSAIWEHTCYCAIDPADRGRYAGSAAACLPSGGLLAGVFYLTPWDPGEESDGPPFGVTVEELNACLAPWFDPLDGWKPHSAFPGREEREWIGLFRRR